MQHCSLQFAGDHALHVILLGVGGVIYIPRTLVSLKSLGLDSQRLKKLGSFMLISLCRPDVLWSIFLTFKLIRSGLLACLLASLLILTDRPFLFW